MIIITINRALLISICKMIALLTTLLGLILLGFTVSGRILHKKRLESGEKFQNAAVASNNGLCSSIGSQIMWNGGNAVDASVATSICLGVVEPQSSGLGGGHFMVIYRRSTKSCTIIDARETAPSASYPTMFNDNLNKSSTRGWAAIAVPGELKGLWEAYRLMGRSNWRDLLMPSVELAENGFHVSEALGKALHTDHLTGQETGESIKAETSLSFLINPETGAVYKTGEIMKRPKLATMLRQLADASNPSNLFYHGALADLFAREFDQQRPEAVITKQDLNEYRVQIRDVIATKLPNGMIVCAPPPPSSGAVTAAIINIVGGSEIFANNNNFGKPKNDLSADPGVYHEIVEAMKFAYADRSILGDSSFGPENYTKAMEIASEEWGENVRQRISAYQVFPAEYYGGQFQSTFDHGTAHSSYVDAEGNAVSLTSTINLYFGALRASESTGIIWNNEMDDFSKPSNQPNSFGFLPSPSNFIYPGKRPMSSMSPLIIYEQDSGNVRLVIGAAGGSKIISGTAFATIHTLFFNQTIGRAIDQPRLHDQQYPEKTMYDTGFNEKVVEGLRELGHKMVEERIVNTVNGIFIDENNGYRNAHSDRRKGSDSYPDGF